MRDWLVQAWRWINHPRPTALVAVVGASLFLIGGAVATDGLFGSVSAAWIQAFGSIGAIWGGFALARRSEQRARDQEAERDKSMFRASNQLAMNLADSAAARLRVLASHLGKSDSQSNAMLRVAIATVEGELGALSHFPAISLRETEAIRKFLTLPSLLISARATLQNLQAELGECHDHMRSTHWAMAVKELEAQRKSGAKRAAEFREIIG